MRYMEGKGMVALLGQYAGDKGYTHDHFSQTMEELFCFLVGPYDVTYVAAGMSDQSTDGIAVRTTKQRARKCHNWGSLGGYEEYETIG